MSGLNISNEHNISLRETGLSVCWGNNRILPNAGLNGAGHKCFNTKLISAGISGLLFWCVCSVWWWRVLTPLPFGTDYPPHSQWSWRSVRKIEKGFRRQSVGRHNAWSRSEKDPQISWVSSFPVGFYSKRAWELVAVVFKLHKEWKQHFLYHLHIISWIKLDVIKDIWSIYTNYIQYIVLCMCVTNHFLYIDSTMEDHEGTVHIFNTPVCDS